jgi:hypothetical protein
MGKILNAKYGQIIEYFLNSLKEFLKHDEKIVTSSRR